MGGVQEDEKARVRAEEEKVWARKREEDEREALAAEKAKAELAQQPVKMPENCTRRIRYVADEVPVMAALTPSDASCLATIYANSAAWERQGLVPIQFKTLLTGCEDLEAALKGLTAVVGHKIWAKFFENNEVKAEDYVPTQFGTILYVVFSRLDKKCVAAAHKLAERADATFMTVADKDEVDRQQRAGLYAGNHW